MLLYDTAPEGVTRSRYTILHVTYTNQQTKFHTGTEVPMFQHNSSIEAGNTYNLKICKGPLCNVGNVIFQFSSVICSF